MTFFMPLGIGSNWENNETRYLLRSLEKNFLSDFRFIIYGDPGAKTKWLVNVEYLEMERFYPEKFLKRRKGLRHYEEYYCVLNKVYKFVNSDACPEEFVYIYDDIILLKKINQSGIVNCPESRYNPTAPYRSSKHGRTLWNAFVLSNGKFRYEHHLPLVYKRDNLRDMFNRFPFWDIDVPYSLATLYFNVYWRESQGYPLSEINEYKAGFEGFGGSVACYQIDSEEDVSKAVDGKTWMNYNDTGLFWKPEEYPLQTWIKNNFKERSKFEL